MNLKFIILILILFTGFLMCFYGLGARPLEKWDEETNKEVVSEINQNGFFTDQKLNSKPFFEKPPLWYYLTAIVTKVFSDTNYNLRFVSALSGFLLLFFILFFCKRYFDNNVAIFSGLTFLSTNHLFYLNPEGIFSTHFIRSADMDIMQLLFNFLSLFALVEFEKSKLGRFLILSSVFCGLSILTKGFIGFLIPMTWILWKFSKSFKKKVKWKKFAKNFFRYLLITFGISAPWHIYMLFKFGNDFFQHYFIYHNFERASETLEQHYGWAFFHIQNLLDFNFFNSGVILIIALIYILVTLKFTKLKLGIISIFTLLTLITITLVQTKLAWYLLYVYPTGVIICGFFYGKIYHFFKNELISIVDVTKKKFINSI